jgi:hypothetical protein
MCLSPGDEGLDPRTRRDRIHPNDCGLWMVRCKGKRASARGRSAAQCCDLNQGIG